MGNKNKLDKTDGTPATKRKYNKRHKIKTLKKLQINPFLNLNLSNKIP